MAGSLSACGGMPQDAMYRGFVPRNVFASGPITAGQAQELIARLSAAVDFDAAAGIDRPSPAATAWNDWRMPEDLHVRIERHEAGVWRLMTRVQADRWAPWYYRPEATATVVAHGTWRQGRAPIALVAYGSDVNLLLVKHWLRRLRSGAATATSTWFAVPRSEPDWVDFDLGEIIDDPARWRLLLDGEALSFYALPVNAGAVDPSRDAWRFEVRMPDGVLTRYVTRLVFSAPAAAPPAAAPPAATPPAAGGTP